MYTIENLYKSKRFRLIELRITGKKQTPGILCFKGSPSWLDRTGQVVCAVEDGVVMRSMRCYNPGSRDYRRGRIVEIVGEMGVSITYGRLAASYVKDGDYVRAGEPIGVEGSSGAGKGEFLTLEFRRTGRHVDGCSILGIDCVCPQEWTEPKNDTPRRLIDASALLEHAREVLCEHGMVTVVTVRDILDAPVLPDARRCEE